METTRFAFADQQTAPGAAEPPFERALAYAIMLRRAFYFSLSRRRDGVEWELLESAVAGTLESSGADPRRQEWFAAADRRLQASVTKLLKARDHKSRRLSHFRRAVEQVRENAALWGESLDETETAYCAHSALVWMTLWHLADIPDMTAGHARDCLDFSFNGSFLPEKVAAKKEGWSLSEAANSLAAAFRKRA
jgi:hypothetical protein